MSASDCSHSAVPVPDKKVAGILASTVRLPGVHKSPTVSLMDVYKCELTGV